MRILKSRFNMLFLSAMMSGGISLALADSPVNLDTPDRHSVEVKGKVSLYRVQSEGMSLGTGSEKTEAEVFISLDSNPKIVYSLQLRADSPVANQIMADTLRDAYIKNLSVTLYHQMAVKDKANNLKILMVQLSK